MLEAPLAPDDPTLPGIRPKPSGASLLGQFVLGIILGLVIPLIALLLLWLLHPAAGLLAGAGAILVLIVLGVVLRKPLFALGVLAALAIAPLMVFAACLAAIGLAH